MFHLCAGGSGLCSHLSRHHLKPWKKSFKIIIKILREIREELIIRKQEESIIKGIFWEKKNLQTKSNEKINSIEESGNEIEDVSEYKAKK